MPLKTAKPCYRIISLPDRYIVTAFPVVNLRRIQAGSVVITRGDPVAFTEQVDGLILKTRERFAPPGK